MLSRGRPACPMIIILEAPPRSSRRPLPVAKELVASPAHPATVS